MEYDLHIHSRYSFDSRSDPEAIIETALKKGLHGIAITDHDTIEGALAIREMAQGRLQVVIGMEATVEGGDLIGLYLTEAVITRNPHEFIDGVKAQGGLVFMPHPFRYTHRLDEEVVAKLDGIEGYNGRSSHLRQVDPTWGEEKVRRYAEAHGLFTLANSDAHVPRHIGRGRTIVPASTLPDLKREMLRRNTLLCGPRRSALSVAVGELTGAVTTRIRGWMDQRRMERMAVEEEVRQRQAAVPEEGEEPPQ